MALKKCPNCNNACGASTLVCPVKNCNYYFYPNKKVHGTIYYYKKGCRCDECKAANAAKTKVDRSLRKEFNINIPETVHGTLGGYSNWYCTCGRCLEKIKEYRRNRKLKNFFTDSTSSKAD